MKNIVLIIFIILFTGQLFSQDCPSHSITFKNQNEIDAFLIDYPNCTTIIGSLTIKHQGSFGQIKNLEGLSNIDSIHGSLTIENTDLNDLSELDGIKFIYQNISIVNNIELERLFTDWNLSLNHKLTLDNNSKLTTPFEGVEHFIGSIEFKNTNLTNLTFLSETKSISGSLLIENTNHLESHSGCDNLEYIGGDLEIKSNIDSEITGFNKLVTVKGKINWGNCYSIIGFNALDTLNKSLDFFSTDYIKTVEGFSNLTHINGSFNTSNVRLTTLSGFESLKSVNGDFVIEELRSSSMPKFQELQSVEGNMAFQKNGVEIIENFNMLNSVGGYISIKSNNALSKIEGFNGLEIMKLGIGIEDNPNLLSISGFNNLDSLSSGLSIESNELLNSIEGFSSFSKALSFQFINLPELESIPEFDLLIEATNKIEFSGLSGLAPY